MELNTFKKKCFFEFSNKKLVMYITCLSMQRYISINVVVSSKMQRNLRLNLFGLFPQKGYFKSFESKPKRNQVHLKSYEQEEKGALVHLYSIYLNFNSYFGLKGKAWTVIWHRSRITRITLILRIGTQS